jgi:hypothetical protein
MSINTQYKGFSAYTFNFLQIKSGTNTYIFNKLILPLYLKTFKTNVYKLRVQAIYNNIIQDTQYYDINTLQVKILTISLSTNDFPLTFTSLFTLDSGILDPVTPTSFYYTVPDSSGNNFYAIIFQNTDSVSHTINISTTGISFSITLLAGQIFILSVFPSTTITTDYSVTGDSAISYRVVYGQNPSNLSNPFTLSFAEVDSGLSVIDSINLNPSIKFLSVQI